MQIKPLYNKIRLSIIEFFRRDRVLLRVTGAVKDISESSICLRISLSAEDKYKSLFKLRYNLYPSEKDLKNPYAYSDRYKDLKSINKGDRVDLLGTFWNTGVMSSTYSESKFDTDDFYSHFADSRFSNDHDYIHKIDLIVCNIIYQSKFTRKKEESCFIATAVYGDYDHPDV